MERAARRPLPRPDAVHPWGASLFPGGERNRFARAECGHLISVPVSNSAFPDRISDSQAAEATLTDEQRSAVDRLLRSVG